MHNWKKTIWKVPLYCTAAEIIGFWLSIHLLQWAIVRQPDGVITSDPLRTNIVRQISGPFSHRPTNIKEETPTMPCGHCWGFSIV